MIGLFRRHAGAHGKAITPAANLPRLAVRRVGSVSSSMGRGGRPPPSARGLLLDARARTGGGCGCSYQNPKIVLRTALHQHGPAYAAALRCFTIDFVRRACTPQAHCIEGAYKVPSLRGCWRFYRAKACATNRLCLLNKTGVLSGDEIYPDIANTAKKPLARRRCR